MVLRQIGVCRIQCWFSLFVLWTGNTLFGKFGPKNQDFQFILKFVSWVNSNNQNSMDIFNSSAFFFIITLFEQILSKKSKSSIFSLIPICRNHWWWSLFSISTTNTFFGEFGPKNQNCQFIPKFGARANSN